MNKSDLTAALAAQENLTEQQAKDTVNLIFNSTNGWLQFDFHRLEVAPWPVGTMLFMR